MEQNSNRGDEPDWKDVGKIPIARLASISDTSYFFDEALIIPLQRGDYLASVRTSQTHGGGRVIGVRLAGFAGPLSRGRQMGTVLVDFGQIGICDRQAVQSGFASLGDEGMPRYYAQLNTTEPVTWVRLPSAVEMLVVRPASGDGVFPVWEIVGPGGLRAGFEIGLHISAKA
jgi:hypothetical protein